MCVISLNFRFICKLFFFIAIIQNSVYKSHWLFNSFYYHYYSHYIILFIIIHKHI